MTTENPFRGLKDEDLPKTIEIDGTKLTVEKHPDPDRTEYWGKENGALMVIGSKPGLAGRSLIRQFEKYRVLYGKKG